MKHEVKPVKTDDLNKDVEKEVEKKLIEKAQRQQEAAVKINAILKENDLRLVVEQVIRIVPND